MTIETQTDEQFLEPQYLPVMLVDGAFVYLEEMNFKVVELNTRTCNILLNSCAKKYLMSMDVAASMSDAAPQPTNINKATSTPPTAA